MNELHSLSSILSHCTSNWTDYDDLYKRTESAHKHTHAIWTLKIQKLVMSREFTLKRHEKECQNECNQKNICFNFCLRSWFICLIFWFAFDIGLLMASNNIKWLMPCYILTLSASQQRWYFCHAFSSIGVISRGTLTHIYTQRKQTICIKVTSHFDVLLGKTISFAWRPHHDYILIRIISIGSFRFYQRRKNMR